MKEYKGSPLPLGVTEYEDYVNFAVEVKADASCNLALYKKGSDKPVEKILLSNHDAVGNVRFVALPKSKVKEKEYLYEIDGKPVLDPYAKSALTYEDGTRAMVLHRAYDWEGDKPLHIPYHEVVAYSMHIRGFTKHASSKVKKKGTFTGVVEKLPYLEELGINQIQCMPVYSFCEQETYTNYWGYGEGYFFAPQEKYASVKDAVKELKDMVKACHKAGIEVVLNMPFCQGTPVQVMIDCLRYYVMEYHVDGFILNPVLAPMESIKADAILGETKILEQKDDFQNVMRRFLRGDEGITEEVMSWLRCHTQQVGSCNYITNHTGYTMADLVSYEEKHNEANGEHNQDGPDYNCSWNCGTEGPTQKKEILELRRRQVRNAFALLLLSQGTPCILAGDEFGNSQGGNNNVYCQDNETAWLNWNQLDKEQDLTEYVKTLISLRKTYPVLSGDKPLLGRDKTSCGVPDVSFHGENAWQIPQGINNRHLGVYYHNKEHDCFIAYNMHWNPHKIALPALPKGKKWYRVLSTAQEENMPVEVVEENQKTVEVEGRTILFFVGR